MNTIPEKLFLNGQTLDSFTKDVVDDLAQSEKLEKASGDLSQSGAILTIDGVEVKGFADDESLGPFTISLQQLEDFDACSEGLQRFCATFGIPFSRIWPDSIYNFRYSILHVIHGQNTPSDLWWLADQMEAEGLLEWKHVHAALVATSRLFLPQLKDELTSNEFEVVRPYLLGEVSTGRNRADFLIARAKLRGLPDELREMARDLLSSFWREEIYLTGECVNDCGIDREAQNAIFMELFSHVES